VTCIKFSRQNPQTQGAPRERDEFLIVVFTNLVEYEKKNNRISIVKCNLT